MPGAGAGKRAGAQKPLRGASRAAKAYGKDTDKTRSLLDAFDLPILLDISATLVLILISSQIARTTDGATEAHSSLPQKPPCIREREAEVFEQTGLQRHCSAHANPTDTGR